MANQEKEGRFLKLAHGNNAGYSYPERKRWVKERGSWKNTEMEEDSNMRDAARVKMRTEKMAKVTLHGKHEDRFTMAADEVAAKIMALAQAAC